LEKILRVYSLNYIDLSSTELDSLSKVSDSRFVDRKKKCGRNERFLLKDF
jgi:hypothetical protein